MRRPAARRLVEPGQHCCLGQGNILHALAEIIVGSRRHPEIAAAHIGAVEIEFENLVLGIIPLQPHGQISFHDLAFDGALGRQKQLLGQLLGQRRAAMQRGIAGGIGHQRAQRTDDVDAEMLVEPSVFRRQRRLDQVVGHFVQRHAVIRADAAPADFLAIAIEEHHRVILGLVEGAAVDDVEGRQRQRRHQHRADGTEGEGIGQNFDEEAFYAGDMKPAHEILVARIGAAQGLPELVQRGIQPGVRRQHAAGRLALFFPGIERILHATPRAPLAGELSTSGGQCNLIAGI